MVSRIPLTGYRMEAYRRLGLRFGSGTTILMNTEIQGMREIEIGENTVINNSCYLDGRGRLLVGNNVNISSHVTVVSGTHDVNDGDNFAGAVQQIIVEDYVWLCTRSLILGGITVGRGAVVAAGAVVTRSVPEYAIVAGVPARQIGERNRDLSYTLKYDLSWK